MYFLIWLSVEYLIVDIIIYDYLVLFECFFIFVILGNKSLFLIIKIWYILKFIFLCKDIVIIVIVIVNFFYFYLWLNIFRVRKDLFKIYSMLINLYVNICLY